MFIFTIKAHTLKLIGSLFASAFIIFAVIFLTPEGKLSNAIEVAAQKGVGFDKIETNEDRIDFLSQYGWEVEPEAHNVREIIIPMEFDKTYRDYNQLQKDEGLDLERYRGKSVKIYTYLVNNYEYDGSVYASVIIYKNKVIGGDISSAKHDGFMHGFTKPNT